MVEVVCILHIASSSKAAQKLEQETKPRFGIKLTGVTSWSECSRHMILQLKIQKDDRGLKTTPGIDFTKS